MRNNQQKIRPREFMANELWAMGYTDSQIAKRMTISTRTVQAHIRNFRERNQCQSRPDVFKWFLKNIWKWSIEIESGDNDNHYLCYHFVYGNRSYSCTLPAGWGGKVELSSP